MASFYDPTIHILVVATWYSSSGPMMCPSLHSSTWTKYRCSPALGTTRPPTPPSLYPSLLRSRSADGMGISLPTTTTAHLLHLSANPPSGKEVSSSLGLGRSPSAAPLERETSPSGNEEVVEEGSVLALWGYGGVPTHAEPPMSDTGSRVGDCAVELLVSPGWIAAMSSKLDPPGSASGCLASSVGGPSNILEELEIAAVGRPPAPPASFSSVGILECSALGEGSLSPSGTSGPPVVVRTFSLPSGVVSSLGASPDLLLSWYRSSRTSIPPFDNR